MNLLLFSAGDVRAPGLLVVDDRRARHLRQVLGAQPGDTIRVGEINGRMGRGEVTAIDEHRAEIHFSLETPPPPKLPVTVLLALPRPKMLRRILRSVAEFGVESLVLLNSYRVEKSYWQTPVLAEATLRDYLLQGLEQGRDTVLPDVHLERRFKPFVEDRLPALLAGARGLLAHPAQNAPLMPAGTGRRTVVAIGPEGGFIPYEVEKLLEAGFSPVTLGPRVLRVETALDATLGRLLAPGASNG